MTAASPAVRPEAPGEALSALAVSLIERYQDGLPLVREPFAALARDLDVDERAVLETLRALRADGVLARVGPVFTPLTIGASTLAALAVPPAELDRVAALISAYDEVNHNYEREHPYNLWFVVTGPDRGRVGAVLAEIGARTGFEPLDLPLVEPYHIDLGFRPWGEAERRARPGICAPATLDALERRITAALEGGLDIRPDPFAGVAARAGCDVEAVVERLARLLEIGVVKRFGLVVRHRELGYRANAMLVMDVPDDDVDAVGRRLAEEPSVTLCYRRPRRPPRWRFNLFCMVHGRERPAVLAEVERLRTVGGVADADAEVLFSARRFKQRGASYARTGGSRPWVA